MKFIIITVALAAAAFFIAKKLKAKKEVEVPAKKAVTKAKSRGGASSSEDLSNYYKGTRDAK